ncbi:MAG: response regulator transcription factor [Vicinamibacterales bacterium]
MRVLVVEDDPEISRFVVRGLTEERHVVDLVEDGPSAIEQATAEEYDAVMLDLMLPGADGFEVCRQLRARGVDTPVIMVTARDAVADRVAGLDGGADDFLVKPFSFDELLARLRAVGRRGRTRHVSHLLEYADVAVDPVAHTVRVAGQAVALTATEYRLLAFLVRRAEAIVTRDQLAQHVWGGDYDPLSNNADVYVGYVRRKLAAAGAAARIHTVRGLGYVLRTGDPS